MTHPGQPSGPTGPGREVFPLTADQRADNYRRQAGRLTARQQRRIRHKANRALVYRPGPEPGPSPAPRPQSPPPPPPPN